jgi:hypothetical protein
MIKRVKNYEIMQEILVQTYQKPRSREYRKPLEKFITSLEELEKEGDLKERKDDIMIEQNLLKKFTYEIENKVINKIPLHLSKFGITKSMGVTILGQGRETAKNSNERPAINLRNEIAEEISVSRGSFWDM